MMQRRLATLLLLGWCLLAGAATSLPPEGRPAPALDATLIDGSHFTLDSARGDVVLVVFWATWCGPCRHEIPVLDAFYRRHRDKGLRLLAISVDDPFSESAVRQFMAPYVLPYAMANDVDARGYGRAGRIPLTFIIDRRGILRRSGWFTETERFGSELERIVLPLLADEWRKP